MSQPIADFCKAVDALLETESKGLLELGLPLCTAVTAATRYHIEGTQVTLPQFQLPAYRFFTIPSIVTVRPCSFAPLTVQPGYFLTGSTSLLEEATDCGTHKGLAEVVRRYPGHWLCRDPYAVYKYVAYLMVVNPTTAAFRDLNIRRGAHPVHKCTEIPAERLQQLQGQARVFVPSTPQAVQLTVGSDGTCTPSPSDLGVEATALFCQFPTLSSEYAYGYSSIKILPVADVRLSAFKQLLESLRSVKAPLIFELVGTGSSIYFRLSYAPVDREHVREQLTGHFPQFVLIEEPTMRDRIGAAARAFTMQYTIAAHPHWAVHFLKTERESSHTAGHLLRFLSTLNSKESACAQFIISPFSATAFKLLDESIESYAGHSTSFDRHAEQISTELLNKIEKGLVNTKYERVEKKEYRVYNGCYYVDYGIYYELNPLIKQAIDEGGKALKKKQPGWLLGLRFTASTPALCEKFQRNYLAHSETDTQRWDVSKPKPVPSTYPYLRAWNVVSTDELASLVHFPTKEISSDRLELVTTASTHPPALYTETGVILGVSEAHGVTQTVTLPVSVRDRHLYLVGKTRSGKSTLLGNIIRQDIEQGRGVCVIDPHGDLVEQLLHYIPKDRVKDTIYFNTSDSVHPIGLRVMDAESDDEIGLLAEDLLITFKRLSESWGERMENILRHIFHTLLRAPRTTFLDVQRMLLDEQFREQVLSHIRFKPLKDFWRQQFPNLPKDAIQPILVRMGKFILSPALNNILGQVDGTLNFTEVIQHKKILLVNLSQGMIGEENSKLLGAVIVSLFQLHIMRRARLPKEQRHPIMLFADEFQNFTTSAFEKILSEVGKYQLCLGMAHQYISQLDEKTRNAILGNVGTMVMFQLGLSDAQFLKTELGKYEAADLTNLASQKREALCKPATQSKDTFKFRTLPTPPVTESFDREIIENTKRRYGRREKVSPPVPVIVTPLPESAPASVPPREVSQPSAAIPPVPVIQNPVPAVPKEFATTKDKVLHYVTQAEYLSNSQIVALCYGHLSEASKLPGASRDLKQLVESKKLKMQPFGKSKIYCAGRSCNPTTHNLMIRELFVKIILSGFEIAETNFFPNLDTLTPDLAVNFVAADGGVIKTFWEYDTGTEGISELVKKANRYARYRDDHRITFVFDTAERLAQAANSMQSHYIHFAVLNEFTHLGDASFTAGAGQDKKPFWNGKE